MNDKGSEMKDSMKRLSDLEAERDYFRQVAERLGRKALADAQDFSRMIRDLRQREMKLKQSREELEKTIEQRTAELVTRNQELSDSSRRYDSLVKRIPHGVYTLRVRDTGAMQFEYLSPRLCQILDIDPEEIKRNAGLAFSIAHPDDREGLESSTRTATERRIPFRWEGRFTIRHEVRWIRIEADPTITPAGDIIWNGVISDITEHKQVERFLRDVIAKNPMSIQILDKDGLTLEVNDSYKSLFGSVPPPGYSIFRDRQLLQMGMGELFDQLQNGANVRFPDTYFNAHDSVPEFPDVPAWIRTLGFPINDSNEKPERFVLMHENITERKRAVQMLRASEEHLSSIFRSAPIGIGSVVKRELVRVNSRLCQMTGFDEGELVGQSSRILYPSSEDFEFVGREKYAQIRDHGTGTVETHWQRKDGTIIEVLLSSTPVDMRDHSKGVTFTALDITERKRAEEERERLQMQLIQSQKMEAIGQLAGGVAHDFNNMLGVILGYSELILEQGDPSQQFHAELEEIQKAARRSADLTRQLLTFARKQTVTPRVLDLNQTVEGMLSMLRRLIGENINLLWMPGNGLWPIKMDPSQIDQILANLCVNARDAIAGVGGITVATENTLLTEEYCATHAGSVPGEYVKIAVSDTGVGMDKETLAHIFEPFFTTKGVGEGTGLGLATVYGAVKQNNGFIDACSEPGRGTTFTIYIPRFTDKVIPAAVIVAAEPIATGTETILLVEDEPMILTMTTQMLVGQGYHVLTAASPWEAIRLAKKHAGSIDLLMTDVIMPEMNGRDLAKLLLSISPDINRLFMSGYTANVIEPHGILDEGVHFIQKPFSMKDLAAAVREALEG
jgi:PAS domain S-box-containing protein